MPQKSTASAARASAEAADWDELRSVARAEDASIEQAGVPLSAGVLEELVGEAVDVAGLAASVALLRGEMWSDYDAALVAVEDGFVVISTDTGNGNERSISRRIVLATGHRGTLLVPPAAGERLEALTPSRITIVSADSLRILLRLPSVAETIADAFAEALRESQATIRNCAYVLHSERVLESFSSSHVVTVGPFPAESELIFR